METLSDAIRKYLYAVPKPDTECFYGNPSRAPVRCQGHERFCCIDDIPSGLWTGLAKLDKKSEVSLRFLDCRKTLSAADKTHEYTIAAILEWLWAEHCTNTKTHARLDCFEETGTQLMKGYSLIMYRVLSMLGMSVNDILDETAYRTSYFPRMRINQIRNDPNPIIENPITAAASAGDNWYEFGWRYNKSNPKREPGLSVAFLDVSPSAALVVLKVLQRTQGDSTDRKSRGNKTAARLRSEWKSGATVETPPIAFGNLSWGLKSRTTSHTSEFLVAAAIESWLSDSQKADTYRDALRAKLKAHQ